MPTLSEEGRARLNDVANRHGVSLGVVEHLLGALLAGQSTQAQFNHPELGGMGQWSLGGMTMVGDMFNNNLKARVDNLCTELSNLIRSTDFHAAPSHQSQSQSGHPAGMSSAGVSLFVAGGSHSSNWWPDDLGTPSSVGSQNNLRYALFPASRRLAIDIAGRVTVYDTGDHQIGGFSQQQSGDQSLTFTSQYGLVRVSDLAIIHPDDAGQVKPEADTGAGSGAGIDAAAPGAVVTEIAEVAAEHAPSPPPVQRAAEPHQPAVMKPAPDAAFEDDIFAKIERLAALHAKGILTDAEYSDKKADLLSRL